MSHTLPTPPKGTARALYAIAYRSHEEPLKVRTDTDRYATRAEVLARCEYWRDVYGADCYPVAITSKDLRVRIGGGAR
jgi:hypothetical protein